MHDGEVKFRVDEYPYTFEKDKQKQQEETEANYFAASLLVPEDKLRMILRETDNIYAIAKYFDVSESTIKVRINWIASNSF